MIGISTGYTPFGEVSFGYAATEIGTNYTTSGDVTLTITHTGGNFDSTGHISTPTSGNTSSVFDKTQEKWSVTGSVAEVDAILTSLVFFPADKSTVRNWTPTALKSNTTSGNFGTSENPPTIGATTFSAVLTDTNGAVASETITFTPVEVEYDNQRPYFTAIPPATTSLQTNTQNQALNFGTIAHGSDDKNVRVYGLFQSHASSGALTDILDNSAGHIETTSDKYIGTKLPDTPDPSNPVSSTRFDFTGSLSEAQAFLDTLEYGTDSNNTTFNLWLILTDGQIGTQVFTVCHFPQTLNMTTFPDQTITEDANLYFTNATGVSLSGFGGIEADEWYATFTIDSTGLPGVDSVVGGTLSGNVFTTTTYSSFSALMGAMGSTRINIIDDFNTEFSIDVAVHGANSLYGTSYALANPQTINVTILDTDEVSYPNTSHTYTEDTQYNFNNGVGTYPMIGHPTTDTFEVVFTFPSSTSTPGMWRHGSAGTVSSTATTFTVTGVRDDVNTALSNLYYNPGADFNGNHTITFTVNRTSGDLTFHTTTNGQFVMTGVNTNEVSQTSTTDIDWEEDVYKTFDSTLSIVDTAADSNSSLPAWGSEYTLTARGKYMDWSQTPAVGVALANVEWDTNVTSYTSKTGTGTVADPLIIVGTKAQINAVLADLKMKADADFSESPATGGASGTDGQFWIEYHIKRNIDNAVLTNYTLTTQFNPGTTNGYSHTQQSDIAWTEENTQDFTTGLLITDKADENSDYAQHQSTYTASLQLQKWVTNQYLDFTGLTLSTTTTSGITTAGSGTQASPYTITGLKSDVNIALANLRITPEIDFTSTDQTSAPVGGSYVIGQLTRNQDSVDLVTTVGTDWSQPILAGVETLEYDWGAGGQSYYEDIADQHIFTNTGLRIRDGAEAIDWTVTYESTIRIEPTTAGVLDNGAHTKTMTGSKASVNAQINATTWTPVAENNDTLTAYYTQDRILGGVTTNQLPETQIFTANAIATAEYVYGTANSNIQYVVPDTANPVVPGQVLHPKQLATNKGLSYSTPITITDMYEDGGASQYKLEFTGVPTGALLHDQGGQFPVSNPHSIEWTSKTNIAFLLANGIRVSGATTSFNLAFTLYRKTATNIETTLDTGSLTYTYLSGLSTLYRYTTAGYKIVTSGSSVHAISESLNQTTSGYYGYGQPRYDVTIVPATSGYTLSMNNVASNMTYGATSGSPQGHGTGFHYIIDTSVNQPTSAAFTNSAIHTSDLTLTTNYGTYDTVTNVSFNTTAVGTSDQSNYGNIYPYTNTDFLRKTSGYWDGTYAIPQYRAMELDGSMQSTGADISQRFEAQFTNSEDQPIGGFHRCLMSGPQSYFYAFRLMRDGQYGSNTGDVTIEMFTQTSPNGTWMPGSGNQMPGATIKSGYSNLYTSPDYEFYCSIHDVKYDSANQDIYVLSILQVSGSAAYANIYKLHYDGVATGIGSHTSYAWSLVKEFQILSSTELYDVEAYLSNDCSSVVMMQTELSSSGAIDTTASVNRLRVYDKDQGGTNNWGLAVTQNYTAYIVDAYNKTERPKGTRKQGFFHDQLYCAYNGVDTFITGDGYKVFQKNQGGTNTWNENATLSGQLYCYAANWLPYTQNHGTFGFTQDYLFFAGNKHVQIFDKSTFQPLTNGAPANNNITTGVNTLTTSGQGVFYYNIGQSDFDMPLHPTLDTSLDHNTVVVSHHNADGLDSPTAGHEIQYKIYKLVT